MIIHDQGEVVGGRVRYEAEYASQSVSSELGTQVSSRNCGTAVGEEEEEEEDTYDDETTH